MSVETATFVGTDRFAVQRCLGSGSFGTVYDVFDRERGAPVALKVLKQADPAAIYRFKKEFRALADVTHSNLVELYELMSEGARWFFTMELVDGADFLSHVRGETSPLRVSSVIGPSEELEAETLDVEFPAPQADRVLTLDWGRLRSSLLQLAEGLSALHASGRVHRDIKPQNVLVTRDGRVVILDFGLVAELTPAPVDRSTGLHAVGTPAYMSPEQATGLAVNEASDWYSVGVILYEALTGVLPFQGQTLELLARKLQEQPIPPSERAPGIPADLDLLCRQLLSREEKERPSGVEILQRLRGNEGVPQSSIAHRPRPSQRAPFVGRKEHLAALHDAFVRTKTGRPVVLVVRGSSGMGKSTLVRHFLSELVGRESTAVVLDGRCYERESMPYKALDSLIDALSQYLRRLPPHEAEALLPRDVLTLTRLFPVLGRVEVVSRARRKEQEIPDSQELRRRAVAALRELLARLADRVPLVLFIDDLQWGDPDSAGLLSAILGPPDPPPLLLIGCTRIRDLDAPGKGSFLPSDAPGMEDDPLSNPEELFVEQFSPEEAEELARRLLLSGGQSAAEMADPIALESHGNPLFLDELVRASLSEQGSGHPAVPLTLHDLVGGRVSRLPDEARRLLEVVAVAGEPVERSVAFLAADLESHGAEAVTLLRASGLVRSSRMKGLDVLETSHDYVRETVVRGLSAEALKSHHLWLARALEGRGQADPESLAVHFHAAEEANTAAEYATRAARQAFEALAFDRAARLYSLALELGTDGTKTRPLRVALGDALANAGRGAEAADAYIAAVQGASAPESVELKRRAAEQLLRTGHVDRGLAVIREVLRAVGMTLPGGPRRALLSALFRMAWIRLRGIGFHERDASQVPAELLLRIDVCWSVVLGLGLIDTIRSNDYEARHLLLALRAGEPYRLARALAFHAGFSATGGGRRSGRSRRRTERLRNASVSLATRIGHPHALALSTGVASGMIAFLEGRWRTAHELLDRAEGILRDRCTNVSWELDTVRFYSLRSLVFMGRFEEISLRLPSYVGDAHSRGDLFAEINLRTRVSANSLLALDKVERAREEFREMLPLWSHHGYHVQHYYNLHGQAEIDLYEGNPKAAWGRVAADWPRFKRSLLRRVQLIFLESAYLHARTVLAAVAAGEIPANRLTLAERDARQIDRESMPWSDPFAQLIRASAAALRGDVPGAVDLLGYAESGFEATDQGLYAAVARFRRAQLVGGSEGERLMADAEAWMKKERVVNPARLCMAFAPGRWGASTS